MVPLLTLLLSTTTPPQERDYLGWPFSPHTFPLCLQHGCTVIRQPPTQPLEGGTVHLALKQLPVKLQLYLAPDQSVMALSMLIPGKTSAKNHLDLLQRTVNNAAHQTFDPSMLPRCLEKTLRLLPTSGNAERRGIVLTHNHYGVQCIIKRYRGDLYTGALVFFDR